MKKIQVYPSDEVIEKLSADAKQSGKSISRIIADIVEEYYGFADKDDYLQTEIEDDILREIEEYVFYSEYYVPFEISEASETFQKLEGKKMNSIRASVGRRFARLVGTGSFTDVRKVVSNNETAYSLNNALLYERYVPEYENGTYKETEEYQEILDYFRCNCLSTPDEIADGLDCRISLVELYYKEMQTMIAEEIARGEIYDPWGYEIMSGYMDELINMKEE